MTTLKEKAYRMLKKKIVNGELSPGEYLTETKLAEILGMSRTPIRAALERLDVEGLASYTPNKGLIVAEMTMSRIVDSFDFRKALEGYVVNKLAQRTLSEEEREWFEDNLNLQKRFVEEENYVGFTDADLNFHRQLILLHGNKEILNAIDLRQLPLHQMALGVLRKDRERISVSYDDHRRIFDLIVSGDGAEAAAHMIRHLEFGLKILIS